MLIHLDEEPRVGSQYLLMTSFYDYHSSERTKAPEPHLQLSHATKGSIRICSLRALQCTAEGCRAAQLQRPSCKWSSSLLCPGSSPSPLDHARDLRASACAFKWHRGNLSRYRLAQVKSGPFTDPVLSEERSVAPQASTLLSCRVQQERKEDLSPAEKILQRQLKLGSGPGSAFADIWICCTATMLLWISSIIAINNSRNSKWC